MQPWFWSFFPMLTWSLIQTRWWAKWSFKTFEMCEKRDKKHILFFLGNFYMLHILSVSFNSNPNTCVPTNNWKQSQIQKVSRSFKMFWESAFCPAFWKCSPRLGSRLVWKNAQTRELGMTGEPSSDPLHSLGQPLGSLPLFLLTLNDPMRCMWGREAGKQHGRILGVFLKPALMQDRNVTVLQALCSSLGRERVRAALASSVLRLYNFQQTDPLWLLSGSGSLPFIDVKKKTWLERFSFVLLCLRRMCLVDY